MPALLAGVPVCCAMANEGMANDDAPTASAAAMASVLIVDINDLLSRYTGVKRGSQNHVPRTCSASVFRKSWNRASAQCYECVMLDVANVRQDTIGEDAQRAHDLVLRQRTEVDQ